MLDDMPLRYTYIGNALGITRVLETEISQPKNTIDGTDGSVSVRTIVVENKGRLSAGRAARARTQAGPSVPYGHARRFTRAQLRRCSEIIAALLYCINSLVTHRVFRRQRRSPRTVHRTTTHYQRYPGVARMITITVRPETSPDPCARSRRLVNAARRVRRPATKPIDNAHNLDPIGLLISVAISNDA